MAQFRKHHAAAAAKERKMMPQFLKAALLAVSVASVIYTLDIASLGCNGRSLRSSLAVHPLGKNSGPVAILISGQCHRFTYREQDDPLLVMSDSSSASPPQFEVFVALQCGERPEQPMNGFVDAPSYLQDMNSLNITDIEQWYLARGAYRVTVKILDDEFMETADKYLKEQTTKPHLGAANDFEAQNLEDTLKRGRWKIESRKLFARHTVYQMARQVKTHFSAYVYWREDNFFLKPLDIDAVILKKNTSDDQPFVVVDAPCTFASYSDKMYVANRPGADMLFGRNNAEFVEKMKRYVLFAYYRTGSFHAMQPESFIQDSLSTSTVESFDMLRTDVRYNQGVLCVADIYFGCLPEHSKSLAKERGLRNCDTISQEAGDAKL